MTTIKEEILNKVMLEEFGKSWEKGYFEETNMQSTALTCKEGINKTLEKVAKAIDKCFDEPISVCRNCNTHWDGIVARCERCGQKALEIYIDIEDVEKFKQKLGIIGK